MYCNTRRQLLIRRVHKVQESHHRGVHRERGGALPFRPLPLLPPPPPSTRPHARPAPPPRVQAQADTESTAPLQVRGGLKSWPFAYFEWKNR